MAPFEIEYGSGHNLIIHRSFKPSCFSTRERAANLLSFATSRLTKLESTVLETMKEHVDPTTVAVAAMNHLQRITCQRRATRLGECVWILGRYRIVYGAYPSGNPYTKPAIVKHVE